MDLSPQKTYKEVHDASQDMNNTSTTYTNDNAR